MKRRKYTQKQRADQQARTRARIVDALVDLHQELGPAHTSIKAVAERAGVERLTVYRHFPDDASLLRACSSHYLQLHPPPDAKQWWNCDDPTERTGMALRVLYAYYRETAAMFHNSYRDADLLPELKDIMQAFDGYLDELQAQLLKGLPLRGRRRQHMKNTVRHALAFSTWESLDRQELADSKKVELVSGWLACIWHSGPERNL